MTLPAETLTILVFVSIGLSVLVLIAFAVVAATRKTREPAEPSRLDPVIRGLFQDHANSIGRLEQAIRTLNGTDKRQEASIQQAVRRVAVLRYDAFEDVGGRLSFSCAMLDDHGDGVVLTSINGRQDTRVYAKPISGGASSYNLSLEEEEAIKQALAGSREAVTAR